MHFCNDPLYHFSKFSSLVGSRPLVLILPAIYKDRGYLDGHTWKWDLLGLNNEKYGECFAYGGYGWDCKLPTRSELGERKFRCITEFDAKIFESCHPVKAEADGQGEADYQGDVDD